MRELLKFIFRFHLFILFLILEVISFTYLFTSSNYHRSKFYTSSNYIVGTVYKTYSGITDYLNLKDQNNDLISENTFLRNHHIYNIISDTTKSDSILYKKYNYLSAKVINNSVYKENNFITLDIGANSGVKPEMAVISSLGIVGITRYVSESFTTVISVLNRKLRVSTKIKRNGFYGSLEWSGENYMHAKFNEIPVHVNIIIGDTLVTSGYSAIFPEGIKVGIIENYSALQGDNFYDIDVKLLVDYKNLSNVYVIMNLFQDEQINLETLTIDD